MKKPNYHDDFIEELKDPKFALGYLNACLEDDFDEGTFLLALRYVAEAHGFVRLAKKANLSREHLFRMLSKKGNPRLTSLQSIAHVFGWRLALVEDKRHSNMKRAA